MQFETAIENAVEEDVERNFTQSIDLIINFKGMDLSDPENRFNEDFKLPYKADDDIKIGIIGDTLINNTDEADREVTQDELEEMFENPSEAKDLASEMTFLIAEAPLMPKIGQHLGQVFGPRNMMPDPTPPGSDTTEQIQELRNTVTLRLKEDPLLQLKVGKEDYDLENVSRNAESVYEFIEERLPQGMNNVKSVLVKTTMGTPTEVER
jgi:large subunit ribosomal protein L1